MQGTLNALGIIGVAVGTGVLLWRYGKRPPDFGIVAYGVVFGVLSLFIGIMFTFPFSQCLVPSACLALVYIFIPNNRLVAIAMTVLFLAGIALGFHFVLLAAGERYSGNPSEVNHYAHNAQQGNIKMINTAAEMVMIDNPEQAEKTYPAKALAQTGIWPLLQQAAPEIGKPSLADHCYTTHRLWHTWLTGLYGKTGTPMVLWYPGGKLKDGIKHLEYRPKAGSAS